MKNASENEIAAAIQGIRSRLDTLASITASNICIPGGPQEQYHQIVEEAYFALGLIETQVDELRAELEYQHKRLDEARDAALAQSMRESDESFHVPDHDPHWDYAAEMHDQEQQSKPRVDIEAEDAEEQAHQDWSNDE
jgi:hypothetical protein